MTVESIISITISIVAILVSIIGVVFNNIWQIKNRKNDIKPMIILNFLDCYTEGYVPQIKYEADNKLGENAQFYLKLNNVGLGSALNIKIYYTDDLIQYVAHTFPLAIKADANNILTIYVEDIILGKEFSIDVSYEDIDGNKYYSSQNGIWALYGEKEYRPIKTYTEKKIPILNPQKTTYAKYIEEEL